MSKDWSDLLPRILTAVAMVAVFVLSLIGGGGYFIVLMCLVALVAIGEVSRIIRDANKTGLFMAIAALIALSVLSLSFMRLTYGVTAVVFIIGAVVATDILGYFGGRIVGGPKVWPAVSPKKTWSGVISGWIGAIMLAVYMQQPVWIAFCLSVFAQMGDFAESSFKRRFDVKDSSGILPGHGGVLDRFDGHIAAALIAGLIAVAGLWPEGVV